MHLNRGRTWRFRTHTQRSCTLYITLALTYALSSKVYIFCQKEPYQTTAYLPSNTRSRVKTNPRDFRVRSSSREPGNKYGLFPSYKSQLLHSRFLGCHAMLRPSLPGGTPYSGLYGEAPPERGTFFELQAYKRVGISQVEVYKRVGK